MNYASLTETEYYGPEKRTRLADWRDLFASSMVEEASKSDYQDYITINKNTSRGVFSCTVGGPHKRRGYNVIVYREPYLYERGWNEGDFFCSCGTGWNRVCVHMAAAMIRFEDEHGPFYVTETDNEVAGRLKKEEKTRILWERKQRWEEFKDEVFPAVDYFREKIEDSGKDSFVYFDLESILKGYVTDSFCVERADELKKIEPMERLDAHEDRDGNKVVEGSVYCFDDYEPTAIASGVMKEKSIRNLSCNCENTRDGHMCEHMLVLVDAMGKLAARTFSGDATDETAEEFFRNLEEAGKIEKYEKEKSANLSERKKIIDIAPRIIMEAGKARVTFRISNENGKYYICRNLNDMLEAYDNQSVLGISKKAQIDFAACDFADDALKWVDFIRRRSSENEGVNEKLAKRNFGYGRSIAFRHDQNLAGAFLDYFYETAEGTSIVYEDKSNGIKGAKIDVGSYDVRFCVELDNITDARGRFAGISVSGLIPVLLKGGAYDYTLDEKHLSRVSQRDKKMLYPFGKAADESGYFRFNVGLSHFREFYYRVLPGLSENPSVEVTDRCGDEPYEHLLPEAEFKFKLDHEDGEIRLLANVIYDSEESILDGRAPAHGKVMRDTLQEHRVLTVIEEMFDYCGDDGIWHMDVSEEERLYDFLAIGVDELNELGEVLGTEFFKQFRLRKLPQMQIGISVESGIMDLKLTSNEFDEEELLSLLDSYRKKKRFYRLSAGTFVDLTDIESLAETEELFRGLNVWLEDAVTGKARLPMYRALYLETMLEEHERIASERDRTYRALIRNFKSIQNTEYEPPESLANILRPYQSYGYKWLKTLEEAGFGGILADEMGLGKTLQMISLVASDAAAGINEPSLVVCPASLVYNWLEEIGRFAPELKCMVSSGAQTARRRELGKAGDYDIVITSYDLLRIDIKYYEKQNFNICVLDEAQYIKNTAAAVTKSVKILHARHRFALTGTPIENRLSELWSIFDFLMPGFLHSPREFAEIYEKPIMKEKNLGVREQLKRVVAPFILRRQKSEVLKDLPEKLEEVRYARFSGEQQKVYDAQVLHMKKMLQDGFNTGEDKIKILAELTKIRQICCDPSLIFEDYKGESAKREAVKELIESAMEGGHRMLVFSQFTSMLALIEEDFREAGIEYYKITGSTPKQERLTLVHRFNEGSVPVFLISLKAGGTGLNLTGADVVIHYDPWWNMAAQNQATDRAHRIGQTKRVSVYRMIIKDTIEEKILQLQETKRDLAEAILEGAGESLSSMSAAELMALLE